jgi:hypothetical protein
MCLQKYEVHFLTVSLFLRNYNVLEHKAFRDTGLSRCYLQNWNILQGQSMNYLCVREQYDDALSLSLRHSISFASLQQLGRTCTVASNLKTNSLFSRPPTVKITLNKVTI